MGLGDEFKRQWGRAKEEQETEEHYQARLRIDRCEKGKGCCALRVLENEPDFLNEKSLLEVEITRYVRWFINGFESYCSGWLIKLIGLVTNASFIQNFIANSTILNSSRVQ